MAYRPRIVAPAAFFEVVVVVVWSGIEPDAMPGVHAAKCAAVVMVCSSSSIAAWYCALVYPIATDQYVIACVSTLSIGAMSLPCSCCTRCK